jgi:hypothetical protein
VEFLDVEVSSLANLVFVSDLLPDSLTNLV